MCLKVKLLEIRTDKINTFRVNFGRVLVVNDKQTSFQPGVTHVALNLRPIFLIGFLDAIFLELVEPLLVGALDLKKMILARHALNDAIQGAVKKAVVSRNVVLLPKNLVPRSLQEKDSLILYAIPQAEKHDHPALKRLRDKPSEFEPKFS